MTGTPSLRGLVLSTAWVSLLFTACVRPESTATPPPEDLTEHQASGLDECLLGDWVMRTADLDLLVATIVPVPNLRIVDGSLFLSFADGQYRYGSDGFVERIDMGSAEEYLQGTAVFLTTGTYAAEEGDIPLAIGGAEAPVTGGGAVTFMGDGAQKEAVEWLVYKNGRTQTAPGGGPTASVPLNGRYRYSCSEQELIMFMAGMTGEVPMFFKREG